MLLDNKACEEQVERFRACFGESVKVNIKEAERVAEKFEWDLAASYFLRGRGAQSYNRIKDEAEKRYQKITLPVWAEYQAAKSFSKKSYESSMAFADKTFNRHEIEGYADHLRYKKQAWKMYQDEVTKAWHKCRAIKVPALRKYEKELAVAFARCVRKWGIREGA
jgi:hypothetical protein